MSPKKAGPAARAAIMAAAAFPVMLATAAEPAPKDRVPTAKDTPEHMTEAAVRARADLNRLPEQVRAAAEAKIRRAFGTDPEAAGHAQFLRRRVGPGGAYPIDRALEIAERERAEAALLAAGGWSLRGDEPPQPIMSGWTSIGPGNVGGRTRAIVWAPDDDPDDGEDRSYLLAGGVAGGVFKSDDDGATWRAVSGSMANLAVSTIAVDPLDPSVVWVGTGEGLAPRYSDDGDAPPGMDGTVGFPGNGLYYSNDYGESFCRAWGVKDKDKSPAGGCSNRISPPDLIGDPVPYINKVVISEVRNPKTDEPYLFVATDDGLFRHINGADTGPDPQNPEYFWEEVLFDQNITDVIVVPPVGAGTPMPEETMVFAAGSLGLWVSLDAGESWWLVDDEEKIDPDDPDDPQGIFRIDSPLRGRLSLSVLKGTNSAPAWLYVMMARRSSLVMEDTLPLYSREIPGNAVVSIFRAPLDICDEIDGDCDGSGDQGVSIRRDDNDQVIGVDVKFEAVLNRGQDAPDANRLLLSDALFSGVCSGLVIPTFSVGDIAGVIRVDPSSDPASPETHTVWVGGVDLYRSDDGARNFGVGSYWYLDQGDPGALHGYQHGIAFSPSYDGAGDATMFVVGDGGIYHTDNALAPVAEELCPFLPDGDAAEIVWADSNNGYAVTQFFHGDSGNVDSPHPFEDAGPIAQSVPGRDVFIGSSFGNGIVRSYKRHCTDGWETILPGSGGYIAIDPTNNDRAFMGVAGIYDIRRLDADPVTGEDAVADITGRARPGTIGDLTPDPVDAAFVPPVTLDASDPDRPVLWTAGKRPWRSFNPRAADPENVAWEMAAMENDPAFAFLDAFSFVVSAVSVAPSDPNVVYLGTEDGLIYRTGNALEADPADIIWQEFIQLRITQFYVSNIAVDPDDPNIIWVANGRFPDRFDFNPRLYRVAFTPDKDNADLVQPLNPDDIKIMDGSDCDDKDMIDPTLPEVPANWVVLRKCATSDCEQIGGSCLVFVGTDIGVYVSDDAWNTDDMLGCDFNGTPEDSLTWRLVNSPDQDGDSLPLVHVSSIDMRDENTLVAFTYGRGAYIGEIADVPTRYCSGETEKPCSPADLAPPFGQLDTSDLVRFIQDWSQGRRSADIGCTGVVGEPPCLQQDCGNGVFDLPDVVAFTSHFNKGCP